MPDKNPEAIFAVPCAIHSLLLLPRDSVISSIRFRVKRLSISPTPATIAANGKISDNVCQFKSINGIVKGGKVPLIVSPGAKVSATAAVGIPKRTTIPEITRIATNEEGIALVILGNSHIISMVATTSPTIIPNSKKPLFSNSTLLTPTPEKNSVNEGLSSTIDVKFGNCAINIMIASPFTKPYITGWGTKRINFPSLNTPARICNNPANITVANTNCIIWSLPIPGISLRS